MSEVDRILSSSQRHRLSMFSLTQRIPIAGIVYLSRAAVNIRGSAKALCLPLLSLVIQSRLRALWDVVAPLSGSSAPRQLND